MQVRARIFGPCCAGANGPRLLAALTSHACNEARALGYEYVVTNLAADDPIQAVFAIRADPPRFLKLYKLYTLFLQKDISPLPGISLPASGPPPHFSPGAFHDPRDIA